jgi:MFS transporter, FSR family, fosmidomycin resistance protein
MAIRNSNSREDFSHRAAFESTYSLPTQSDITDTKSVNNNRRKALLAACVAHALHDGYTDQLYALLPIWQSEFGLSYAGLAVVRALFYGTMGGLQVPGDRLIARLGPRMALTLATFVAAAGYLVMALPCGFASLCIGLVIAGVGSSAQHPRASLLVTNTYGGRSASIISPAILGKRLSPRP